MTDTLTFRIPFRPGSLKNGQRILRLKDGRTIIRAKDSVMTEKGALVAIINQAIADQRWRILEDESVAVQITDNTDSETVTVRVSVLGPKPKGRTGRKRDLHNITDLVCDAMQRAVFTNDNQIGRVTLTRMVGGREA